VNGDRTLASRLVSAFQGASAIGPGLDLPDLTIAEGYAVQQLVDAGFRAAGREPIGWKIGHTSPEPMVGIIYADSLLQDGGALDLAQTCATTLVTRPCCTHWHRSNWR
jgi:2-keto-4-pentenoate hydratase